MKLNVRRTFTTTTPPGPVFDYLADFRNTTTWDPGTVSCSLLGSSVEAGATYRNTSRFLGRETVLTYTTVTHQPPTRLHFRGVNESFVGDDRLSFAPDGTGTRVGYHATFELSGAAALAAPVVAVYLPFLASKTVKQLRETLDGLTV
ncbi:MAG: SRPBCC family protein [Marmoricola sp.]